MHVAIILILCLCTAAAAVEAVFLNGNIHTLDPERPRASAIAVADGRIVAIGTDEEVLAFAGPDTERVDLGRRTVVPGLIDAHGHLGGLGSLRIGRIDLAATKSYDDLLERLATSAARAAPGTWLLGGRWDQADWGRDDFPAHGPLSAITPEHPVWLTRVDGHAGRANARALALAGITRDTEDPPGGEILRDAAGEPTGMLIDNAMDLVSTVIPADQRGDRAAAFLAAQEACLAVGLTGVHDAGVAPSEVPIWRGLVDDGRLKLRVYCMLTARGAVEYVPAHPPLVDYGGRLTVRAIKCMVDGAMGSRGAWLLQPYSDRPTDSEGAPYTGLPVMQPEFILEVSRLALRHGYQVATHAIGDRGNRETLDAYAQALAEQPRRDHRFRVEHAQTLHLEDIPRFAQLGVIPSMQPTHCTSDMRWVEDRIGPERVEGAYAWARLLRHGSRIAGGSDFPIESENPLLGLFAAVTRQNEELEPAGGWRAEECLTREEALRAFTIDAAQAGFQETSRGTLEVGKLADFSVFDRDILRCSHAELLTTECQLTVIGGEVVFRRE